MGISIVLYRVATANEFEELKNLTSQIDPSKSVNLYQVTQDLGIIFMNTANPYRNTMTVQYRMLYGKYLDEKAGNRIINGFVSSKEIISICEWIRNTKVDTYDGFSQMYDNLSKDALQELIEIGADDKESLFSAYIQPLTLFYLSALEEKNSIIICGE